MLFLLALFLQAQAPPRIPPAVYVKPPVTYSLTIRVVGKGNLVGFKCLTGSYAPKTEIECTVPPLIFVGLAEWKGSGSAQSCSRKVNARKPRAEICSFMLTENSELTATFAEIKEPRVDVPAAPAFSSCHVVQAVIHCPPAKDR